MRFTDQSLKPFGNVLLDISVETKLGYKTALVFRVLHELQSAGYLPSYGYNMAEVSLEEAISNAMLHGNKLDANLVVRVVVFVDDKRFGIIVQDQGKGFSPGDVPDPNDPASQMLEHGRGILLMDHYMDSVEYSDGGTVVRMVRERQSEPDPGSTPPSTKIIGDDEEEVRMPQAGDSSISLTPVEINITPDAPVDVPDELELDADLSDGDEVAQDMPLVEVVERGGVTIARIHAARFTEDNVHEVRQALLEASRHAQRFVIEMSEVQFMSSVGIGTIMAIYKTVQQHKGNAVLAGLTPGVESVLKATGMLRVLEVHPDERSATEKFGGAK